jgi:nucleoid-associated protein YgaU
LRRVIAVRGTTVAPLNVKPSAARRSLAVGFFHVDTENISMADHRESSPDFSDVRGGSSSSAPSVRTDQERKITVQAGDSLSKIAKRELGDAKKWPEIYEANRDQIKNPDLIHPGQVLTLPLNG